MSLKAIILNYFCDFCHSAYLLLFVDLEISDLCWSQNLVPADCVCPIVYRELCHC